LQDLLQDGALQERFEEGGEGGKEEGPSVERGGDIVVDLEQSVEDCRF
jgi:hypothetical protein